MTTFFTLDVDEGRREGQGLGARAEALRRLRHARLQSTAEREVGSNYPPGSESYHETLQMSAAYIAALWIIHLFIGG